MLRQTKNTRPRGVCQKLFCNGVRKNYDNTKCPQGFFAASFPEIEIIIVSINILYPGFGKIATFKFFIRQNTARRGFKQIRFYPRCRCRVAKNPKSNG